MRKNKIRFFFSFFVKFSLNRFKTFSRIFFQYFFKKFCHKMQSKHSGFHNDIRAVLSVFKCVKLCPSVIKAKSCVFRLLFNVSKHQLKKVNKTY